VSTPPPLVYNELLGHLVRSEPWLEQGRSSYARVGDALGSGDFETAEAYGRVTVQEAQEAYDLFAAWLIEIPQILTANGVQRDVVDQRQGSITAEIGEHQLDAGWRTYRGRIDDFAEACQRSDSPSATALLERARTTWQRHHDSACETICALFEFAATTLGEEFIGALWDSLLAGMYERSASVYDPDNLPWDQAVPRLLLDIFEATRGHLTGADRDGTFSISEDDDRWVITFAPCGSGGRTYEFDSAADPSADPQFARRLSVTTGKHDWAWNTPGVCLYCTHCCQLQQRAPIKRLGFPLRVIDPPTQGQPKPLCTWSIYKDPTKAPDDAYTKVGFDPPPPR
jgi:hypothetical protein